MNKKQEELTELFKSFSEGTQKGLYKVVDKLEQRIASLEIDKLEQRIASLEKVLASHAKCIGEMREDKVYIETLNGPEIREEKTW